MDSQKSNQQQLEERSKRLGFFAAVLFFLSALSAGIAFSFFLVFGMAGIYCAFLWIYYANQASPKKKPFEDQNPPSGFFGYDSKTILKKPNYPAIIAVAGGMLFVFLVVVFTNTAPPEETTSGDIELDSGVLEPENYSAILKDDPTNIDALTNVGNTFYDNQNYDSALYYYDKVLRIDVNNSPALYNKSLVLFNKKDYSGAAELASRCIQIDASNTDALMLLGDCYENQNNHHLALTNYSKAYELGARTSGLSNVLGYLYDTKGNTGKAISFYKEALEQDSSKADVYTRLAELEPEKKVWYEKKAIEWKTK